MDIRNLLEKRGELADRAREILRNNVDGEGRITANAAEEHKKIMNRIEELTATIERQQSQDNLDNYLAKPLNKPILEQPNIPEEFTLSGGFNTMATSATNKNFGVQGKEYRQKFFDQFKSGFRFANNYLKESVLTSGGYLVPTEFHDEIVKRLTDKNVMRQISRVIETNNDRDLIIQATAPSVHWIDEGGEVSLTNMTFDKKTLGAHKLGTSIAVTNELLADSYYNIADHIYSEFTTAVAQEEENVFLNGVASDTSTPTGLLNQLVDSDTAITTAGASIAGDDIINVETKLDTPYRKGACWLVNPVTLGAIRKLKDGQGNYLWQTNFTESAPPQILGYPVYCSPYMPTIAAGATVVLFGDFSRFFIGQRGDMVFKPLFETRAMTDETVYLLLERVDCVLSDTNAIVSLKIKSA